MYKKSTLWIFNHNTLTKWILSCCLILLIPLASIIVNYFYTRNLISEKITEANAISLGSIQNSIDDNLSSILNTAWYLSLDETFQRLGRGYTDTSQYDSILDDCLNRLKIYRHLYPDMDILVYLPFLDYVLTNSTANSTEYIHNTLTTLYRMDTGIDEWREILGKNYKNQFLLDSQLSYSNYKKDSFVFASANPFVYHEHLLYNIFVSVPCDFVDPLIGDMEGSTFLIIDKNGTLIKQFGAPISYEELPLSPQLPAEANARSIHLKNTNYILSYQRSDVCNWYYVVCTPSSLYMKEALYIRNATLFSLLAVIILGLAAIVALQLRNYRPVQKLLGLLPAGAGSSSQSEFELLEDYYRRLFEENRSMRNSLQSQKEYAREFYLLSKLKGRQFHLSEPDMRDGLELDLSARQYGIASIYVNFEQEDSTREHFELMSFSIANVMDELFAGGFSYHRAVDEVFFVYLFTFNGDGEDLWYDTCVAKFQQICDFFRDSFHIELSITTSSLFGDYEHLSSYYADILDAFEYRYVIGESGVLSVDSLKSIDFSTMEQLEEYSRRFSLAISKKDTDNAVLLCRQLFLEQKQSGEPFFLCRYHIFSVMDSLLFTYRHSLNAEPETEQISNRLAALLSCDGLNSLEQEFEKLCLLMCGSGHRAQNQESAAANHLVNRIRSYVEENYSDCSMNISSIASAMGLTPKYMSKLFKDAADEGLLSYVNTVRIRHAIELLQTTDDTMDEISLKVGFTNSRSFRRNFTKVSGQKPSAYRR